jgi:Uma2 family endonuclease
LWVALKGSTCRMANSDLRLAVSPDGLYTYPDAIVICGEPQFLHPDTITNPVVIFEVLSPSTAAYDRGPKFRHYRSIPALREYILVSQDDYLIERYERRSQECWLLSETSGIDQSVTLQSVPCTLALRDIYYEIDLSEPAEG